MNEQVGTVEDRPIDRTETDRGTRHDAGKGNKSRPDRVGHWNVELLKRTFPEQGYTFPGERRIERITVDVGVIIPERKKLKCADLGINGSHDQKDHRENRCWEPNRALSLAEIAS